MLKKLLLSAVVASTFVGGVVHAGPHELTVAQRQDPGSWDPIDTFLVAWSSAGGGLFDGLILRDESLKLQPGLAEKWEELDNGLRIRFTLRQNVKFHNGEPFNADAVKFTFERLLGEEGKKGPQRSNYTAIQEVKVIDANTVDFILNKPDPVLLTKLSGYGAMIVPPKYIAEKGDAYFNEHPVGTGAFKFESYKPGDRLVLVPNNEYWGGKPKLQKLTYRFIKEDATSLAELQSGRVDVWHDVAISAVPILEKSKTNKVVAENGPTIMSLQLDVSKGVTKDVRVRKALNMAIDKKVIIDTFLMGQAEPIASLQGKLSFGYDENLKDYPYDPEQAKKLLAEAGVKPGTKLTIDYRGANSTFAEVSQALTAFFGNIGLNVGLRPVEDAVFLNDIVPQGKTNEMFQFNWGGWTFDFDNTAYLVYHSGEKWNPYLKSEEMDKLLEKQRVAVDKNERLKLLREVAKLAHDQAYHIPLYNSKTLYGISNKVKGFLPAPDVRVRYINADVE